MYNWFSKTAVLAGLLAFGLSSCKKDEVKVTSEFGAAPVLAASTTNLGVLSKADSLKTAVTYSWNPYTVTASGDAKIVSPVTYVLQFAKAGTNFATVREISIDGATTSSLVLKTVDANAAFLGLKLPFGQSAQLDVRLKTLIASNVAPLYSAATQLTATPYDQCTAPNTDTWGLVGPAGDGWPGAGLPAPQTDRMLRWNCDANAYILRTTLNAGDFKLRQNQKWDINLGGLSKPLVPGTTATPLKTNGEDMTVATAGTYTLKLTVVGSGTTVTAGTLTVTP